MTINDAILFLESNGYSIDEINTIKTKIINLKKQMYKLEDEAEQLDIKSSRQSHYSLFSKNKIFDDDINLEAIAIKKRSEARKIANQIRELQKLL